MLRQRSLGGDYGREIFKAIYFLQGSIVDEIDYLKMQRDVAIESTGVSASQFATFIKYADKFVNKIDQTEPDFFIRFEQKMKCGNPLVVKETIAEGAATIFKTAVKDKQLRILLFASSELTKKIDFKPRLSKHVTYPD